MSISNLTPRSRWDLWLSLLTFICLLINWKFDITPLHEWIWLGACMVLTGIPHGATDHLVHRHHLRVVGKPFSWQGFMAPYLLKTFAYGVCWWISPLASLGLFLLLTFYHFGQSELYYLDLPESHWQKRTLYLLWGGGIMTLLLLGHASETVVYLKDIVPVAWLDTAIWSSIYLPLVSVLFAAWTVGMGYLWASGRVQKEDMIREIAVTVLLSISLHVFSLWVGFGLYFGLWHATKAIRAEMDELRTTEPHWSLRDWIRQALPFSLVSFAGLAVLVMTWRLWGGNINPVLLFFAGIAMLTLPHMLTLEGLYRLIYKRDVRKVIPGS